MNKGQFDDSGFLKFYLQNISNFILNLFLISIYIFLIFKIYNLKENYLIIYLLLIIKLYATKIPEILNFLKRHFFPRD